MGFDLASRARTEIWLLVLGQPRDDIQEEVAVALGAQELVGGEIRGADHHEARLRGLLGGVGGVAVLLTWRPRRAGLWRRSPTARPESRPPARRRRVDGRDRGHRERPPLVLWVGLGLAALQRVLSVSPRTARAGAGQRLDGGALGRALVTSMERESGKSVMSSPRSRVIGRGSYWVTTGTSGPSPKARPMGLSSTTRSSPTSKP